MERGQKFKNRLMALLLVLVFLMLAGCSGAADNGSDNITVQTEGTTAGNSEETEEEIEEETTEEETTEETTSEYEDIVDAPSFKLGFIHTSFSDQLGTMYQKYAQYAADELGCEIMFTETGSDTDKRQSAVENMIEVGCEGIITSNITEPMIKACKEAEVYIILVGNSIADPALAEVAAENPYYIGAVLVDNFEVGYNMAEAMYEAGCRNVALLKWTPGSITTMDDRAKGIETFIEEHPDMELATVFTGTATQFTEGTEQILASYSGIDGIISVMANTSIASAIYSYGLNGQIKYAGVDIQEGTDELLADGTMTYVAGGAFPNAEICVAMLYNYLTGYKIWEDSQEPIKRPLVELKSVEDYENYMFYLEGNTPAYTGDELKEIIGIYNNEVTLEDVIALTQDASLESVKIRHADLID